MKSTVPLYKVVAAAIIDTHEDIGRTQQTYTHWAARGLKKLHRETLPSGIRRVILTVNRSTHTATLPPDFKEETFIGVIVNGRKVPLKLRTDLVNEKGIEEIECEDKCERCNQDKSICEDLKITEETSIVVIEGNNYTQTVIKKMYPDGRYYLETKIPVWDYDSNVVIYTTTKEFIAAINLKPCGCVDETPENLEIVRNCNYDVWCQHFAPCDTCCDENYGGYQIFEETGFIKFDKIGKFTQVYMEYTGFMAKKNGQYVVPEVAFETLVNYIKFKNVENRRSVPVREREYTRQLYITERGNMEKILGRISLSQIVQAIGMIPKFDIDHYVCEPYDRIPATETVTASDDCSATTTAPCPVAPSGGTYTPFGISIIAGVGSGPTPGANVYQDDRLKGSLGVNMIIVNNTPETIAGLQFTLDTSTGILSRWQADGITPNNWQAGDILIVPTFFKIV